MTTEKTKIYFCGSIRAGRQDAEFYRRIIAMLSKHGQVLTEHIGLDDLMTPHLAKFPAGVDSDEKDKVIHDVDMEWLHQAHVVIAECTQPSVGVGFELGVAWKLGLPTLALYRPQKTSNGVTGISAMINGCKSDSWRVFNYSHFDELEPKILEFLEKFPPKS
ncbi:unnamed protein product, partial [Mesorhabditis belari]|uniref:Putative 2'-deoxynucleoside 5'-phosphate N-hydrolase 1 n=1 Tax=Mesorhabditis belari TaxID=2138241 RepID=A0AAF3ELQ7_9BILA